MTAALIEINFSEEFSRRIRKAAPRKHIPTALGVVIAAILVFLSVFYLYLFSREGTLSRNKAALEQLKGKAEESDQIQALHARLQAQASVFDAWEASRLTLAPRWLQLARLAPDGLYLTHIEFSGDDPHTYDQRLLLRGRAAGTAGETVILRFLASLKRDALFTNAFASITLAAVATEQDEKVFAIELSRLPSPRTSQ